MLFTPIVTAPAITSATVTIATSSWSNNSATVTVSGVTASNIVYFSPDASTLDVFENANIQCTTQAANSLTFTCKSIPTDSVTINVLIIDE